MLEIITIAAVLLADQLTKIASVQYLQPLPQSTYKLIEGVLHLTYAQNTGAAFSMLRNHTWILILITAVAILGILYCMVKFRPHLHRLFRFCMALIAGGAIGNFIDRVFLGYVRDMFDFAFMDFAIFNVADAAVTIGVAIIVIDLLFLKDGRALAAKLDAWDKQCKEK